MRETNLQGKACVVPLAVAASLGMAGMGLASSEVAAADITSVTDTLSVEVQLSCTFNSTTNKTYTGSAANGAEVNDFNDSGIHEFNLFCNGSNGYVVTATPYDLEATGIDRKISYTDSYTPSGTNGLWTAVITSEAAGVTVTSPVPVGGGEIISSDSGTTAEGVSFTAAYSAYVGTETPAGTYTGTIVYTLTASGTSTSSGSGSGGTNQNNDNGDNNGDNGGGSGANSDNETTDATDNGGDAGDSGSGAGSGDANSGDSSNTPESTPNNAPLALNNTYNTYSTSSTYSTTNYTSSGTGMTGTQATTSGNTNGTTSGNNDGEGSSKANDDYEQPLGVTTNTSSSSSSSKNSGTDPMPLIAAGVLATAGVAGAIALARSNKEEE
ncbi:hypothetical protein IKF89_01770 [Candidatus Saccharibacteria bacterium]|nr:hypothetical protein [Candidatus Saccharibacteria bacterium]